jgi:hypothetical protein
MTSFIWKQDTELLSIQDMKDMLKDFGSYHSFKSKDEYIKRINHLKTNINFPWREEQQQIIDNFLQFKHRNYIIHAVFGAGKTCLLLGLLVRGIFNKLFKAEEVLFLSYNISIKNEIKRKLKEYGIANKVDVRTYDSIIYQVCKMGGYKYLDLPNFEGKRKFVEELCYEKDFTYKPSFQPKIIFIDETQDLEKQALMVLQHFYPDARFVFAGDIYQSIQKETRESILWYFMTLPEQEDTYKIYMSVTPRVPAKTLATIKTALKIYYPEFKDRIEGWKSSNTTSNADIEWKRFFSYSHIFDELKEFLSTHKPEETMILTFSSAITVRGAMGDVARIRRFLGENGIKVNLDHKKLEPDTYFLTTSNSSKGLERDYVIIFLTFPLEKAFVHLSDDVVVNLITVALTRAKKKVLMFVPAFEDKFSRVLNLFDNCPQPNKDKIHDQIKSLDEFKFQDYIDAEHSVTSLIRASVIKYNTRIKLREYIKCFNSGKIFEEDINYKVLPIITDEEKSFVGILVENLLTSTWVNRWPFLPEHDLQNHPMYTHIIKRITNAEKKYTTYIASNMFDDRNQFDGIYLYSQLHIALSNKIFMNLSDKLKENLKNYWTVLKPRSRELKPNEPKLKIQCNLKMPWLTGVADATTIDDDEKTTSVYEIKASQKRDWQDDAQIQVLCYALMTGKTWSRLHLLNPFQNSKMSYYFDSKSILFLRMQVLQDILIYNVNSMMAKMYPVTKINKRMDVSKTLFLDILRDEENNITQVSLIGMLSAIKCEYLFNKYASSGEKKTKEMGKQKRFACESDVSSEDLLKEIKSILSSEAYKDKIIWSFDDHPDIFTTNSIKAHYDLGCFQDMITFLEYKKNEDKEYALDPNDSFHRNIISLSFMFLKNNFV